VVQLRRTRELAETARDDTLVRAVDERLTALTGVPSEGRPLQ
jgi:hypothetical protein